MHENKHEGVKTLMESACEQFHCGVRLIEAGRIAEGISQLERSSQFFEAQALDAQLQVFGMHLNHAEFAVQVLIALGNIRLCRLDHVAEKNHIALRLVIDRLLTMNKLIKKRYETKVTLLFKVADFLYALGDNQAMTYFSQAEKYYTQQLGYLEGLSLIEPVRELREFVSAQLSAENRTHTMKLHLTAETPKELEDFLVEVKKKILGIRITRKVKQERPGPGTRGGFRATAMVTWTYDTQPSTR